VDIRLRRAYEAPGADDGYRVLVDRLWPRGRTKEDLALDAWTRDLAPSAGLRKWYGHDPDRFEEFRRRYTEELGGHGDQLDELRRRAERGRLTLVFAARDPKLSNAAVLAEVLRARA